MEGAHAVQKGEVGRTHLFLEVRRKGGDNDPIDEVPPGGGQEVQGLNDGLHRGRRLSVGELEAGDAEEDLSASQNDVLGKEPHHVQGVGLGDLLNVDNELALIIFGLQKKRLESFVVSQKGNKCHIYWQGLTM